MYTYLEFFFLSLFAVDKCYYCLLVERFLDYLSERILLFAIYGFGILLLYVTLLVYGIYDKS